jgi:hypothetical protein
MVTLPVYTIGFLFLSISNANSVLPIKQLVSLCLLSIAAISRGPLLRHLRRDIAMMAGLETKRR